MLQIAGEVVPLEMKSEGNLQSRSLQAYREKYTPAMACRTSMLPYKEQEGVTGMPLYAVENVG